LMESAPYSSSGVAGCDESAGDVMDFSGVLNGLLQNQFS